MVIKDYITPTNYTNRSGQKIDRLTVHCAVGQLSADQFCNIMQNKKASANYVIGVNGEINRQVPEEFRAWTSGTGNKLGSNDMRSINIEVASIPGEHNRFNDKSYASLVELATDICKRYKKHLVYIPDKVQALDYKCKSDEMLITLHRWFQATACPDLWFINKLPTFVNDVNKKLVNSAPVNNDKLYRVQVGAFRSRENAEKFLKEVKAKGFTDSFII